MSRAAQSRHFGTHEAGQISPDIDLVLFPGLTGPLRGKPFNIRYQALGYGTRNPLNFGFGLSELSIETRTPSPRIGFRRGSDDPGMR
jgi:hypothetical protein